MLAVSWLLCCGQARAEPDEGAKLVARELMAKGRAQREKRDFSGALESFSRAHAIMHVPTTLLESARAHADVGKWVEALQLLQELTRLPTVADEPSPFARARADALELEQQLGKRLPRLSVDLSGAPRGAVPRLTVDGTPRPECASGCFVNPGRHVVTAVTPRAMAEEQLTLAEGERQALELVFSPLGAPISLATSSARESPRAAPLDPIPTATWISGGVAAAGLTAGAVLGLSAVAQRDELRETCAPHCATAEVDRLRRQVVIANVALGVGLGAAAVAVASYVLAQPPRRSASTAGLDWTVGPAMDARGGQLALGGRF